MISGNDRTGESKAPNLSDNSPQLNEAPAKKSKAMSVFKKTVQNEEGVEQKAEQKQTEVKAMEESGTLVVSGKEKEISLKETLTQEKASVSLEKIDDNHRDIEQHIQIIDILPNGTMVAKRINCAEDTAFKQLREEVKSRYTNETDPGKVKIKNDHVLPLAQKMIKYDPNKSSAGVHADFLKQNPHAKFIVNVDELPSGMSLEDLKNVDFKNPPVGLKFKAVRAMTDEEQEHINGLLKKHLKLHTRLYIAQNNSGMARSPKKSEDTEARPIQSPVINVPPKADSVSMKRGVDPMAHLIEDLAVKNFEISKKRTAKEAELDQYTATQAKRKRLESEEHKKELLAENIEKKDVAYAEDAASHLHSDIDLQNKHVERTKEPKGVGVKETNKPEEVIVTENVSEVPLGSGGEDVDTSLRKERIVIDKHGRTTRQMGDAG